MSRWLKIGLMTLGLGCGCMLMTLAALPWIISSSLGTRGVTYLINQSIPGHLDIGEISLNWRGRQLIKNISLHDRNGTEILKIAKVEGAGSLYQVTLHPFESGDWKISDLQGMLIQDQSGFTNLEDALGLKYLDDHTQQSPVYIEYFQAETTLADRSSIKIKASGQTKQLHLKGEFSLDAALLGNTSTIHLYAHQFPVLVLDQTLAIRHPALSGLLLDLFGDSLDVTLEQNNQEGLLSAQSPHMLIEMKGHLNNEMLYVDPASQVSFNWPAEQVNRWIDTYRKELPIHPLNPLKGKLTINEAILPFNQDALRQFQVNAELIVEGNRYKMEEQQSPLALKEVHLKVETDTKEDLILSVKGEGDKLIQPVSLEFTLRLPKANLLGSNLLEGVQSSGTYTGPVASGAPNTPPIHLSWNGVLRQENTQVSLSFASHAFVLPEVSLSIEKLPSIGFKEVKGVLTLKNIQIKSQSSQTAFKEIAIPWEIDLHANSLNMHFTGIQENGRPKQYLQGSFAVDQWNNDQGFDFSKASMQLQLKLQSIESHLLHSIFPDHSLTRAIGQTLDANIAAIRDVHGNIQGQIQMSGSEDSLAPLKNVLAKFSLSNGNRDVTFQLNTSQVVGKTQIVGTLHDLWDQEGQWHLNLASVSLKGHVNHFPVELMTRLFTGNPLLAKKMEAILGAQVDAELSCEIQDQEGPVRAKITGINGQMNVEGFIQQGFFYLNEPLTASLHVTPQLEQVVISKALPLFSSLVTTDKPVELTIYPEGFSLSLSSPDLSGITIGKGELQLHQMQLMQGSQLGKIVRILNINTDPFDVWVTPLYFSFNHQKLYLQRFDLLVAQAYPLASWGSIDFARDHLQLIVALSGAA